MKQIIVLIFLMPFALAAQLTSGHYTDYTWNYAYVQPQPPQDILNSSDCGQLIAAADCNAIMGANISDEQKRLIIVQDAMNGTDPQNYSGYWNSNIQFGRYAPEGTAIYNGPIMKNTWIRIVSVSPSVTDLNNDTWVPQGAQIGIADNIEMVVNQVNDPSACSINYNIIGYDYTLETYVNGQLVDSRDKNPTISLPMQFGQRENITAELSFVADYETEVSHWYTDPHCAWNCTPTCGNPQYTEVHDAGVVSDSRTVYYYNDNVSAASFIEKDENGSATGWLAAEMPEGRSIEFDIGNAKYYATLNRYQITDTMRPYDILSVSIASNVPHSASIGMSTVGTLARAMPQTRQSKLFDNITNPDAEAYLLTRYETTGGPLNCTVIFTTHFGDSVVLPIDCGLSQLAPVINITLQNATNDTVGATIFFYDNATGKPFSNESMEVSYGGSAWMITTDRNGTSEFDINRTSTGSFLTASFETDAVVPSASSSVFVGPRDPTVNVVGITEIGTAMAAIYYGTKKAALKAVGGLP